MMYYYGIDIIFGKSESESKYGWTISSYEINKSQQSDFGFSPVLGVVFKINPRLSIASEMSYDVFWQKNKSSRTHTPASSFDSHSEGNSLRTQFIGPEFINVRLHF